MVVPLDIIHPSRKFKAQKLARSRVSAGRSPLFHSFDANDWDDLSDSDTESTSESSYLESISSVTTNETSCACSSVSTCSLNPPSFRRMSLSPTLSSSHAVIQFPKASPSHLQSLSILTELLSISEKSQVQDEKRGFSVLTRNLVESTKIKAQQVFSALFVSYPKSQNVTIDLYPEPDMECVRPYIDSASLQPTEYLEQELETFTESTNENCEIVFKKGRLRNREFRMNGEFLKRYALDANARVQGLLPNCPEDVHALLHRASLRQFDSKYGLYKFSEMSREKLWNSVVLPPRSDSYPQDVINTDNYSISQDHYGSSSMVSKLIYKLPWATHQESMRPAGRLKTSSCLKSSCSPTLGQSTPQYTVRGWQNERWVPLLLSV